MIETFAEHITALVRPNHFVDLLSHASARIFEAQSRLDKD